MIYCAEQELKYAPNFSALGRQRKEALYYEMNDKESEWFQNLTYWYLNRRKMKPDYPIVKARICRTIWGYYAQFGLVREYHYRFIDDMKEQVLNVIALMSVTNEICGRYAHSIEQNRYDDYGITPRMRPWFEDWVDGFYMTDFGFPMLWYIAYELMAVESYEQKVVCIDRIFNVWHGSGPLTDRFIEGGMATLNTLKFSTEV